MKKLSLVLVMTTIFSMIIVGATFSQNVSKAILHFGTDEYRLTAAQQWYLDSFSATLRNIPDAYSFRVSGHTDSVGTSVYNNTLSYNRAMAVAAYLQNKGFKQKKIKLEAKGFSTPVADNSNEINKEQNRRVEIQFQLDLPPVISIAGLSTPAQHLELDDKGGTVVTASGTKITVPANAFADINGNPVTGKIDIEYKEYRDPIDFLLSDIPMHFNNGKEAIPFNSAGMFTINASQNNAQLHLKDGKRVNVGFNYDGTVKDANFYRWDAVQRNWTTVQPLSQSLLEPFREYMIWKEGLYSTPICQQHRDLKEVFFVKTGLRYSKPNDSSVYHLYEVVKLYEMQAQTLKKQREYERKAKWMLRKYHIDVEKKFLARTGFKLNQVRGKRDVSSTMLESISFKKNLSNTMIDSLEKMLFDDFTIHQDSKGLSLVLYKGSSTVTIEELTIKQDKATKGFEIDEWINDIEKSNKAYKKMAALYRDTALSYAQQVDFYQDQLNMMPFVSVRTIDSLRCFRDMHDSWMSNENKKLSLGYWLLYYHQNKSSLAAIYTSIQQTDAYVATEKKVQRFLNLMMLYNDPGARLNLSAADVQLPGNFSLSSLGTYNCDQLQGLEDPVTIYAQYTNKQGKAIRPLIALLIDSKLNGILRYDGSYGLSPYRIAFSPKSSCRMVVVDTNGDAYLVKPEEFKGVDLSLNNNSIYTFVAEPIGRANNKDELKQRLNM